MENPRAETHLPEMLETPPEVVASTRRQQAAAPYCGLGFKKSRLDTNLHAHVMEVLAHSVPLFRAEERIREIESKKPDVIPVLYYENRELNDAVAQALLPAHEEWCGMRLEKSACYGFRAYQRGAYLHRHVDRTETHIISSTICVDHRLDSRWPLYIEDIDGKPHHVDLEPGEFLFYEGARLIHGRPYPLNGDYYVGMFVHYRPLLSHSRGPGDQ